MHLRRTILLAFCILIVLGVSLSACKRVTTSNPTVTFTATTKPSETGERTATPQINPYPAVKTPAMVTITSVIYPGPGNQVTASVTSPAYPQPTTENITPTPGQVSPSPAMPSQEETQNVNATPLAETPITPSPSVTPSLTPVPQYPAPPVFPSITPKYPGPVITNTPLPYPGPGTRTAQPSRTPSPSRTASPTSIGTGSPAVSPTATIIPGTPGVIPTELPPRQPISPPPAGSSITIWHSWNSTEAAQLQTIIQAFQKIYPDVTFSLLYVPFNDLYATYEEAAYNGTGPSLLLGPARWGPSLFDEKLVTDLTSYVPDNYLSSINPAGLSTAKYHENLISLPLSLEGMVIFRNAAVIQTTPNTFTDLEAVSNSVTHGGLVGTYLERGAQFSSADIIGLGGQLMDENGYPEFNSEYGLEWFQLLSDYDVAGAVTFNTNWDLEMFKRGRVGIIIDGTWNISYFRQILGVANLAIDPWPTYGKGSLSGWVEADSAFLNPNTTGDDRFATLSFMGYLLDPDVQMHMAEVGHIPSVMDAQPRDSIIQQAMVAFSRGAAYPTNISSDVIKLYQNELDQAIYSVFVTGVAPSEALQTASDDIVTQLKNLSVEP